MDITMLWHTDSDPLEVTTFAARICYSQDIPVLGDVMNVEGQLFNTGHHSTLQHWAGTFLIDGLAVADVDFGPHLTTPFYVTDQQSGRFCLGMYANPDYDAIKAYVSEVYPEVSPAVRDKIACYVEQQMKVYNSRLAEATVLAEQLIRIDRPKAGEEYIATNAPKFAQEQLRMLIPLVFPTRYVYTVNLVALAALYKAAWNPGLRLLTQKMVDALLAEFPKLSFMFVRKENDWSPAVNWSDDPIWTKPGYELLSMDRYPDVMTPTQADKHPVDLLRTDPHFMELATCSARERIVASCAAYGQIQRSRSFRRGAPSFNGALYMPPLLAELGLEEELLRSRSRWSAFQNSVPPMLFASLAPYGAMLRFVHAMDMTALIHEAGERTDWNAQEEFYHLNVYRRKAIEQQGPQSPLLSVLSPNCFGGKMVCDQGKRFCGRDIKSQLTADYFPERRV